MKMYTDEDMRLAAQSVKQCALKTAAALMPLAAVYVWAVLKGMSGVMLAVLLAGFAWLVFSGDMWLMPAVRYAAFLKEMNRGLRRSTVCMLERLENDIQLQDGVRVYAVHVRLPENADTRIFYINVTKANCLPIEGGRVEITSFGRHIVACRGVEA